MPRPYHFELSADDPQRASEFYKSVFGWKIEKWAGPMEYYLVTTGDPKDPGIDGGIQRREGPVGLNLVVGVTDIDEVTEKVLAAGGKLLQPKMPVPGVGWAAYYTDTEGVMFGVMQEDPGAK